MKVFSLLAVTLIGLTTAFAQTPESSVAEAKPKWTEAEATIRENEQKFFEMGQEQGTRAAFLNYLADDSIVFHPGPINGKKEWTQRPAQGISLKWKPKFVWASRSGDLGYSTGPAEWRRAKEDEKPFGYGQFLTIWKKQKDGAWKVALDVGGEVPGQAQTDTDEASSEIHPAESSPVSKADQAAALKKLREAESKFAAAAKADSTIGLTEASLPTVRVHREAVFPAVGKYPAQLMLSVRRGKLSVERSGGAMSEACDLAYSYGKYTLDKPEGAERGHYLQIWRTDENGVWKIALDYQSPLPKEVKKPAK